MDVNEKARLDLAAAVINERDKLINLKRPNDQPMSGSSQGDIAKTDGVSRPQRFLVRSSRNQVKGSRKGAETRRGKS